jgi:hypothetical protein
MMEEALSVRSSNIQAPRVPRTSGNKRELEKNNKKRRLGWVN